MRTFVLSLLGVLFLSAPVQAETVGQVSTGIADKTMAIDAFNDCFIYDEITERTGEAHPATFGVREWKLTPPCPRVHWVAVRSYHMDHHTKYHAVMEILMRETARQYEIDETLAASVDRFESRLVSGELDNDSFYDALRDKLPQTRTAESGGDDELGIVSGVAPLTTRTTWCVDSYGNTVSVSEEACRNTPGYKVTTEDSR
jgi:hypothetical protein